mgnify:CR=1 FL=1|jgi:hypothetical protein
MAVSAFAGLLVAGLLVVAAATGCGKDNGTVPVSGFARFADGTALPAGRVMLYGGDTGPSGQIQPDGSFRLGTFTTSDGARPGRYKVVVTGAAEPDTRPYEEAALHPELAPPSKIHPKYNSAETTDLEVDIGPGTNKIELSLEPNPRLKK